MRPTIVTLELVGERDNGCCARCGLAIWGIRSVDWSLHHRRPAGMGGDRRPETHSAGNLVLLHGSGTTGCHGIVEKYRTDSTDKGFLIPRNALAAPSTFSIEHAVHGLCRLADDGAVIPCVSL